MAAASRRSGGDTLNILNTTIKNNISTSPGGGFGGGIYLACGTLNLTNSHVDNNSAAAGVQGSRRRNLRGPRFGSVTIKNSTVNNNSSYEGGGGIYDGVDWRLDRHQQPDQQQSLRRFGGGGVFVDRTSSPSIVVFTSSSVSGNTTSRRRRRNVFHQRLSGQGRNYRQMHDSTIIPRPATAARFTAT